ncbi:hypothetical protein Thiowin_00240 [Thiorhodovibrio winogradskyi]|uniref:Uncharacterized protein n=1 Tax=Thiorhodovibrio winogradskyi TaxID=77007 RepID=A0ABZ0S427_9GAMM
MKQLTSTQPRVAPDPILAELWEVKRQLNESAHYRIDERARMAHEAAKQVEAHWQKQDTLPRFE